MSPATTSSSSLWNISVPVMTDVFVSRKPTISTGSPFLACPRSTRPVTTVPRPLIENTSSTAIMNGFSVSRFGSGMYSSTTRSSSRMRILRRIRVGDWCCPTPALALPRTIGVVSPGKPVARQQFPQFQLHQFQQFRIVHLSTLFRYTTMLGTSTWRASSTCSRVCGIGPSGAATTRIAPSTCAAPVIMFLM